VGGLDLPDGVELAAVTRFGVPLLVDDSLVLEPDDQVTIVGPEDVMPTPGDPAPVA
jgi:hypothetical protein